MRELKKETVRVKSKEVEVSTIDLEHPDLPVLRVEGKLGGARFAHTFTIGANDAGPVGLTQAQLQSQVDDARQRVADVLAGREEAREMMDRLT